MTGTDQSAEILDRLFDVIESRRGGDGKLAEESADLLYHLLVLWADKGVRPEEVWGVLAGRFGLSGINEKNSREKD